MKKDKRLVGILSLAAATVIVMGISLACGKQAEEGITQQPGTTTAPTQSAESEGNMPVTIEGETLDLTGADASIKAAVKQADGTYVLTVETEGFNESKPIVLNITYAADAKTVLGYQVVSHGETQGFGSNIEGDAFKNQFAGTELPVYIAGMDISAYLENVAESGEQTTVPVQTEGFADGVYETVGETASNGYTPHVTMTVEGGKITAVTWDEEKDGEWKSVLSTTGKYVMKPVWKTQAESMCAYVVENQSTDGLNLNESGKTDVVSGVSISVNNFVDLVNKAITDAAGKDGTYEVVGEPASNGYVAHVTVTIADGKITAVTWDEEKDGEWKSVLSTTGKYVMKPVWKTQAESMCAYVVENQSTAGLNLNDSGKTDVVSGVSISVSGFTSLVEELMSKASLSSYKDGVYEMVGEPASNGYVAHVTVTIAGGRIASVTWDEEKDGEWKSVLSTTGKYVMKPVWKTQAESMCAYVVENQSTEGLNLNESGKTDVVSGVSISVNNFVDLVNKAITDAAGKDGTYEVVGEPASNGYVAHVTVTIADGKITAATWDEEKDGEWKSVLSTTGKYVMKPVWQTQAESMCAYVVENQSTTGLNLNDSGKTDVVSGVSISVNNFVDLVNKALAAADTSAALSDGTFEVVGEPASNGYVAHVAVTVEGGKITAVTWDEENNGEWKSVLSTTGKYVMKPVWKTQAESMCAYVVENQSTDGLNLNESGKTDVVSGVSISVNNFVDLVNKAITDAAGKDGTYEVVGEPASNGYVAHVTVTIADGKITAVTWDEEKDGEWKSVLSTTGKYVMKPVWKTQAESMCAYVVENQSTAGLNLNDSGKTDVVSGVSISVSNFVNLVNQAIADSKGVEVAVQESQTASSENTSATANAGVKVDAISGATISSKAVVRAINNGYVYLRDYIVK